MDQTAPERPCCCCSIQLRTAVKIFSIFSIIGSVFLTLRIIYLIVLFVSL